MAEDQGSAKLIQLIITTTLILSPSHAQAHTHKKQHLIYLLKAYEKKS